METHSREHLAIQHALKTAGIQSKQFATRALSGGCIHRVLQITVDDGRTFVGKLNDSHHKHLFDEEVHSLRAIANTKTVLVPQPLVCETLEGLAVLLMSAIEMSSAHPDWRKFGAQLAAMHNAEMGSRYGFDHDNHIGTTLQPNAWHGDWVEFNAVNRLGFQLQSARDADLLNDKECQRIQLLIDQLEQFIPRRPRCSILHGDLWSGNVVCGKKGIAVIDPACSIGDAWADVAMMRLFGGFPPECFASHANAMQHQDDSSLKLERESWCTSFIMC